MSTPAYLATLIGGAITLIIARYLRSPSLGLSSPERSSVVAGILMGFAVAVSQVLGARSAFEAGLIIAIIIAITSLYLRSRVRPDDFSGLITGALTGIAGAATIVVLRLPGSLFDIIHRTPSDSPYSILSDAAIVIATAPVATLLTVAVRGRSPYRVAVSVAATSACLTAFLVARLLSYGIDPVHLTIVVLAIPPVLLLASLFRQWPLVARELQDDVQLGLFPEREVAGIAHPLRRLGRGGWQDLDTRRKLIRKATELAMAKHRQRKMPDEAARLYQLEIMKLRMEIRDILDIHHELVLDSEDSSRVGSTSDTMSSERATPPR